MVQELLGQGESAEAAGDLAQAAMFYEKALFIAAGAGMDTLEISWLATDARKRLEQEESIRAFGENINEAQARFDMGDYLGARYFANLALSNRPESKQAEDLLDRADKAVEERVSREQEIERGLLMADSLLSYGEIDEARVVTRSLNRVAGEDARVQVALKRVEFAYWQGVTEEAFARAEYGVARAALDSASTRFPDHPWLKSLDNRIAAETQPRQPGSTGQELEPARAATSPEKLSPEMQREVAATYKRGQDLFEKGQLSEAVMEWERVEALAPDYMSVREYLVDAYKFLGVELYTQSKLSEAVDVWKKAANIAPDSVEINNYIKRTEHEISKLQEMSYDRR
jgi:tetratricopeptide (TPR) repeat protein